MMEFNSIKSSLQLEDLLVVWLHLIVPTSRFLHDLVDHQLEVSVDVETAYAMEKCLIFCYAIGGLEVELKGISELCRHSVIRAELHPHAIKCLGAIEVHGPVLLLDWDRRGLLLHPFRHEVVEHLGLDGDAWDVGDVVPHKLQPPLSDATRRLTAIDDVPQGAGGYHRDRVAIKVVTQLALGDEHDIEQILDLRVVGLGVGEHLKSEVHRLTLRTCPSSYRSTTNVVLTARVVATTYKSRVSPLVRETSTGRWLGNA
jgi:hypothetical protein